jgi:hypothetical protein
LQKDVQLVLFGPTDGRKDFIDVSTQTGQFRDEKYVRTVVFTEVEALGQYGSFRITLCTGNVLLIDLLDVQVVLACIFPKVENLTFG